MADQINNLLLLPSDGITRTIDTAAPDVIQIGVDTQFITGANVVIDGNLTVRGTTTTTDSETVLIADNYLYLNNGYETDTAESGGLVVNYDPTTTSDTVAAGGFTAGVAAVSNPTVATTGAATFVLADIIQINGSANPENDGLYEVLSHAANVLTIRGIGTTATVEAFTQNQFVTDTTVAGSIYKVAVSVIRANTSGIWQVGSGSTTPITFSTLATGGSVTLQQAYENGNTISVTSGQGPLAITLTSDDFTVNGGNDVDFGGSAAVLTFNVDASGAVTVDSTSAGISLDGVTASNFTVTGAGQDLTLSSVGGSVVIEGTETVATAVTINGNTGAGGIDINGGSGGITVDTSGALSLDSTGTASNLTLTANDAGTATLTIEVTNGGAGTGVLDINADDAITIDSSTAGVSIDAVTASNFTVTGGNLTLSTVTSGTLEITSAGDMDINGPDNSATAIGIDAGGLDYITIDSTNSAEQIIFHQDISLASGVGFTYDFLVGTGGMTAGDLVTMEYGLSSRVIRADADDAQEDQRFVVGVAKTTTAATGTGKVHTMVGQVVPVTFGAPPATADNGKRVYLSTAAGVGTLTAPISASTNVFVVGILIGGDGATNPANIIYLPQFIARRP